MSICTSSKASINTGKQYNMQHMGINTHHHIYIYIYIYICTSVDAFEHPLVYDWISLRVSVDGH